MASIASLTSTFCCSSCCTHRSSFLMFPASASYIGGAGGASGFFGMASAAKDMRQQIQLSLHRFSTRSAAIASSPLHHHYPPAAATAAAAPSSASVAASHAAAAAAIAHDAGGVASRVDQLPLDENALNNCPSNPIKMHAAEASSKQILFSGSLFGKGKRVSTTRRRSGRMNIFAATRTPLLPSCCISHVKHSTKRRTFATCCLLPATPRLSAAEPAVLPRYTTADADDFRFFRSLSWLSTYKKLCSVECNQHAQSVNCNTTDACTSGHSRISAVAGLDASEDYGLPVPAAAAARRRYAVTRSAATAVARNGGGYVGGSAACDDCHQAATFGVAATLPVSAVGSTVNSAASASVADMPGGDSRSSSAFVAGREEKECSFPWRTPFFFFSSSCSMLLPQRRRFTSVASSPSSAAELSVATAAQQTSEQQQEPDLLHGVKIPSLGDSVTRGTVVEWKKKVGDHVLFDEVLCVIETDKLTVEIHCDCEGVVVAHAAAEGESLNVGDDLAIVRVTDPEIADHASFTTAAASQTLPHHEQQQQQHQQEYQPPPPHYQQQQQQQQQTSTQQQGAGATAGREMQAGSQEGAAAAARGGSKNPRTAEHCGDKIGAAGGGNAGKQHNRKRMPMISFRFGKRWSGAFGDQGKPSPHVAAEERGDALHQGRSADASGADVDSAQDEDPLMQLWGVPRWRPLSEEEIEAVNLGGAGFGEYGMGTWKTAGVETEEEQLRKKRQKSKPKQQEKAS